MSRWHTPNRAIRAALVLGTLVLSAAAQAADNVEFTGVLVHAPCTLHPGDDEQELDFSTVSARDLYVLGQTPSRSFSLRLEDCDTSVMNGVTLTFSGEESTELPGFLAFDAGSLARGVVVGLQSENGQPLPLNGAGMNLALTPGNVLIPLQAYLKVEPTAQGNQGIVKGPFTATATFELTYQ